MTNLQYCEAWNSLQLIKNNGLKPWLATSLVYNFYEAGLSVLESYEGRSGPQQIADYLCKNQDAVIQAIARRYNQNYNHLKDTLSYAGCNNDDCCCGDGTSILVELDYLKAVARWLKDTQKEVSEITYWKSEFEKVAEKRNLLD